MSRHTLIFVASLLAASVGRADPKGDLALKAKQILTTHCYRCHGQNGSNEGGFGWVLDFKKLTESKITPGDPKRSRIYKRMHPDLIGDMPTDTLSKPTAAEIDTIRDWIAAGAPEAPNAVVKERAYVSAQNELDAMRAYLRMAPRADRKSIRFFSLRHLHNLPASSVRDEDLRVYQAALSKLINSLSRKKEIVLPEAADPAKTLFAVNVSRLDWDRKELWNEILKLYPYGVHHEEFPDLESSRETAAEVTTLAGTKVPVVRADWFIATASRPPLYHTLLQLPTNARDLEKEQGVNVAENFTTGKLQRAGFNGSGVSGHNRLVERHESIHGYYWKSYDFRSSAGRGNLFVFPLGPEFEGHPFPRNAFKHQGGEMIFSLPNGLQGYYLVDGDDQRINEGPIEVVSDAKKISGTPAIVNGLSCMSCHQHGMIGLTDQILGSHILAGEAATLLKKQYPEKDAMNRLLERDRQRFLAALTECTKPFLQVGDDAKKSIEEFPEPVSAIARWYLQQDLTIEEAARELGLSDPKVLAATIEANPRLQELGLRPLATKGTVKREVWEDVSSLYSPFQETIRELKLGTPVRHR